MRAAMLTKFGYESGDEIHYLKMSPCIIAEQLLKTDNVHGLTDYKIWCFYGKPYVFLFVVTEIIRRIKFITIITH